MVRESYNWRLEVMGAIASLIAVSALVLYFRHHQSVTTLAGDPLLRDALQECPFPPQADLPLPPGVTAAQHTRWRKQPAMKKWEKCMRRYAHMHYPATPVRVETPEDAQRRADGIIQGGRGMLLGLHQTIILVRVVELDPEDPATPTLLVLKSWRGPFPAGRVLHIEPADACEGNCDSYGFQAVGDELLIFSGGTKEPMLTPLQDWVFPAAESQALMGALDQAVKELQEELQDPQTDITRGPARKRVMHDMKECFANASMHPNGLDAYVTCQGMTISGALWGIKRSELVANWGPPHRCRRISTTDDEFSASTGADCPLDRAPIWTFGGRDGLWCDAQENLRCMNLWWIYGAGT